MMRRVPLWLTLVPLLVAVGVYYLLWQGWARQFEAVVADWLPGASFSVGGFPYRLEATVRNAALAGGEGIRLEASSPKLRINRGPWQQQLTVLAAEYPRFSAVVGPGFGASISGKSAITSINLVEGRLARLSSVVEAANARLAFTSARIAADSFELHLRERFPEAGSDSASPTLPERGQAVIAGRRVRFDGGDALTIDGEIGVTGASRLLGFAAWAGTGTIEVRRLAIADAHGEVAGIKATLVPVGGTSLRFAGTIETICPASVEAAFLGLPPPVEMRLRAPVRLAVDGAAGAVRLSGIPDNLKLRATRAQLPPCPVLRR